MQVVNFFMKLVQEEAKEGVFCHNSFFFEALTADGYNYGYSG
jgi:Ulp1 family protease